MVSFTVTFFHFGNLILIFSLSFSPSSSVLEFIRMVGLKSLPTIKVIASLLLMLHSLLKANVSSVMLLRISLQQILRTQFSMPSDLSVASGPTLPFNTTSNSSRSRSSKRIQSHTLNLRLHLATKSSHLKKFPLWCSEK